MSPLTHVNPLGRRGHVPLDFWTTGPLVISPSPKVAGVFSTAIIAAATNAFLLVCISREQHFFTEPNENKKSELMLMRRATASV